MKNFLEEYGFAILTVIVAVIIIIMLTPVGETIQNSIKTVIYTYKENAKKNSENNFVKKQGISLRPKDVIKINDENFIVIEHKIKNEFLIMSLTPYKKIKFNGPGGNGQTTENCNKEIYGGCYSNYKKSQINEGLNGYYYYNLPDNIRNAIKETEINQKFYEPYYNNPNYRYSDIGGEIFDNGKGVQYKAYKRKKGQPGAHLYKGTNLETEKFKTKIFLLSIEELSKIVDVNDEYESCKFITDMLENNYMVLRDSEDENGHIITFDYDRSSLRGTLSFSNYFSTFPAFVIDLSRVKGKRI